MNHIEHKIMVLEELKHCIRPVVFDLENDFTSYSTKGTSFGVMFDDNFFIVTLKHVITSVPTKNILFPYGGTHKKAFQEFLPIDRKLNFENDNNDEDTDKYELVAFRVDKTKINNNIFDSSTFFKIYKKPINYNNFDMLIIFGYPSEKNYIDYDSKKLIHQRLISGAEYKERSTIEGCHKIRIEKMEKIESYSGLSGSIVFGVLQSGSNKSFVELIGIMIRATKSSEVGHFIEHLGIVELLERSKKY